MNNDDMLCIYHGNCADGFAAAWAVWKRFPGAEFGAGVYGEPPPDVTGRNVVIVDFSYPYDVLVEMSYKARSLLVIDHHKTAAEACERLPNALVGLPNGRDPWGWFLTHVACDWPRMGAVFDMDKSGARLAWEFFHPFDVVPQLVKHVEDRDLWRFALAGTREISAALFSYSYSFAIWDNLVDRCNSGSGWNSLYDAGAAIERKHQKDVTELLAVTRRTMRIGGVDVPVANLPYTMASDAAGALAQEASFGACYYDKPGSRVFSLRSRGEGGADVSAIAKAYGGGGHRNAAGFQVPIGWEGDDA